MNRQRGKPTISKRFSVLTITVLSLACMAAGPSAMDTELLRPHLVAINGGRLLSFNCIGEGSPTVVFEQGGDGNISNWRKVQPAITAVTRTCFYDRAGFGYSDPPPGEVTADAVTNDLRAVLAAKGITEPVVLVGHSIGGFYATVYADRFTRAVAGLVLVDSGFAGQVAKETRAVVAPNTKRQEDIFLRRCAALARAGQLSLKAPQGCFGWDPDQTPDQAAYRLHAVTRPYWYEAELSQSENYFPRDERESVSGLQEMALARSFGDMPMVVLSAESPGRDAWETDETYAAFVAHWHDGHRRLAARSTSGTWQDVQGSGHFIQRDKPDAVIGAVLAVVEKARAKRAR